MPANTFSTGRDCQLVVIGPPTAAGQAGSRVDLTHVTGFESKQMTHAIRIDRMDGVHLAAELPKGWEGHFELERGSSVADDFIASIEAAWFTDGTLLGGTLYQYVNETDGSVSTYQYEGAVFRMTSSGQWKGDSAVKQRLEFFAGRRKRI
jgi:hypothetical protein